MKNINTIFIGFLCFIMSCGPTQEEIKLKEKHLADSIQKAEEIKIENKELNRVHLEKVEVGKAIKKQKLTDIKEDLDEQLDYAKQELQRKNEFQIGRTTSEKQQQLSSQQLRISNIKNRISVLEEEIIKTGVFEVFDFQVMPKKVVEQLILAAKNEDFSKLQYLLDPYGEFDEDVFQVCYSYINEEGKQEFVETFENARIMNEYEYGPDKAGIEIAFGSSSNKLETLKLIRRMDRWYLSSF